MKSIEMILLGVFCCLIATTVNVQAEIYHWVDAQGRRHFGDKPPVEYQANKIKVIENTVESRKVPEKKAETAAKPVVMYSAAWCGVCKRAASYFRQNKIPFEEYDIDKSSKGRREYNKLNGRGVPIILVGKQRMDGFSPDRFQFLYTQN